MNKIYCCSNEEFIEIIKTSNSFRQCCKKLNYGGNNGNDLIKQRCRELGIDINFNRDENSNIPIEQILVENSSYKNRACLKYRLVKEGLLEYKCVSCGNVGIWLGKKLSLQIDHINGKNNDNRLENLRFLCLNCHAQTSTYCGKNIKYN